MSQLDTLTIDKFLGMNKSTTETLLQPGEASDMSNWIITDDYKLKKMFGYIHLFNTLGAHKINGLWYGVISGTVHFIFACNGHIYEHNLITHANTDLGTLVDSYPTSFFANNNTVYIMDGNDIYKWTGSGSIASVPGYVPTVFTATPPSGGGTILEDINYLTGQKIMKFSGDNTATVYQLPEQNITSVDSVVVNGVTKTVTTDYTVNLAAGTITFVVKPPTGVNNVVPTWTKTVAGDRAMITNNRYYGGIYYSRLWLFGNPNHKNTRYCSGVTYAGVSDPSYWPKLTDSDVGEYEITDICIQYNKQLIFTNGDSSGASAWYSTEETYQDASTGIVTTLFPVYPMNAKVGNLARGQTQIIFNNPFTIWKGVFQWISTNVMDEKNAQWISKRIQNDLDTVDLTTAITYDWNDKGIYVLCVGKKLWCYNYRVDAWYSLDLPNTPTCFTAINQELYFGTDGGQIMKFDENLRTYDGTTINAVWKMGFTNFGAEWLRKFIQRLFVTINPEAHAYLDINYQTDVNSYSDTLNAVHSLATFAHADFGHFSFHTNHNPQPFKFKIRAKKIDYFKVILTNDILIGTCTVLSITIPERTGGEVKRRD